MYTITNENYLHTGLPLTINLSIKYDELEEIPNLKNLYINDVPVCISHNNDDDEDMKRSNFYSTMEPSFNQSMSNFFLTDLSFDSFPNITTSPQQVSNVRLNLF